MIERILNFLLGKKTIVNCDGEVYLKRWYLLKLGGFGVYIHKFEKSDEDRALHDHPWGFLVVPLWRGYVEHYQGPQRARSAWADGCERGEVKRTVLPILGTRLRKAEYRHRVEMHKDEQGREKPAWSLFIRFKEVRGWGYWLKSGFVSSSKWWRDNGCDDKQPELSLSWKRVLETEIKIRQGMLEKKEAEISQEAKEEEELRIIRLFLKTLHGYYSQGNLVERGVKKARLHTSASVLRLNGVQVHKIVFPEGSTDETKAKLIITMADQMEAKMQKQDQAPRYRMRIKNKTWERKDEGQMKKNDIVILLDGEEAVIVKVSASGFLVKMEKQVQRMGWNRAPLETILAGDVKGVCATANEAPVGYAIYTGGKHEDIPKEQRGHGIIFKEGDVFKVATRSEDGMLQLIGMSGWWWSKLFVVGEPETLV